ncbi:MAG: hypothetical protein ACK4RS_05035, partial [Thiothrix sp.]
YGMPMMMPYGYALQAPSFEQIQKQMDAQRAQAEAFFKQIEAQRNAMLEQQQKAAAATAPAQTPAAPAAEAKPAEAAPAPAK